MVNWIVDVEFELEVVFGVYEIIVKFWRIAVYLNAIGGPWGFP